MSTMLMAGLKELIQTDGVNKSEVMSMVQDLVRAEVINQQHKITQTSLKEQELSLTRIHEARARNERDIADLRKAHEELKLLVEASRAAFELHARQLQQHREYAQRITEDAQNCVDALASIAKKTLASFRESVVDEIARLHRSIPESRRESPITEAAPSNTTVSVVDSDDEVEEAAPAKRQRTSPDGKYVRKRNVEMHDLIEAEGELDEAVKRMEPLDEPMGLDELLCALKTLKPLEARLPLAVQVIGRVAVVNLTVLDKLVGKFVKKPLPRLSLSDFKDDPRVLVTFRRTEKDDMGAELFRNGSTKQRLNGKAGGGLPWTLELAFQTLPEYDLHRAHGAADDRQNYLIFPAVLLDVECRNGCVLADVKPPSSGPGLIRRDVPMSVERFPHYVAAVRRLAAWIVHGESSQ